MLITDCVTRLNVYLGLLFLARSLKRFLCTLAFFAFSFSFFFYLSSFLSFCRYLYNFIYFYLFFSLFLYLFLCSIYNRKGEKNITFLCFIHLSALSLILTLHLSFAVCFPLCDWLFTCLRRRTITLTSPCPALCNGQMLISTCTCLKWQRDLYGDMKTVKTRHLLEWTHRYTRVDKGWIGLVCQWDLALVIIWTTYWPL